MFLGGNGVLGAEEKEQWGCGTQSGGSDLAPRYARFERRSGALDYEELTLCVVKKNGQQGQCASNKHSDVVRRLVHLAKERRVHVLADLDNLASLGVEFEDPAEPKAQNNSERAFQ